MFAAMIAAIALFAMAPHPAPHATSPTGLTTAAGGTQTVGMAVLSRARLAAGGAAVARLKTLHLHDRVVALGMTGDGDEWDDLVTGRFAQTQSTSLGPLAGTQAYDGTHAWEQDATGLSHYTDGAANMNAAVTQAYTTSLSYWFPQRRPGTIAWRGAKKIGDHSFLVVRAVPAGG